MEIQQRSSRGVTYLEAIPPKPEGPPIILVHGAYNDAGIWSSTFMPWFAKQGRPTYALFLKPPESVAHWSTLFRFNHIDYEQRLAKMVDLMDTPPILVGHSMGGLVVQRYLSHHPEKVAGACLLASLAPFGFRNTLWSMFTHPLRLLQFTLLTINPKIAIQSSFPRPKGLLSSKATSKNQEVFQKHLVRESTRALINCLRPRINIEVVRKLDLRVMGAGLDVLALPGDVIRTAELYGVEPIMRPEMEHFMMLEPGWEELAEEIEGIGV